MPLSSPQFYHKAPAATVRDFVDGIEVRRALDVDTGEPLPPVEEGFWYAFFRETAIKLIKGWAPRQLLKLITAASAAVGGSMMADGETKAAVVTWLIGLFVGGIEIGASKLSKLRWQKKYLKAKAKGGAAKP